MIKLGMIGMSEGNAHPYSWSAIVNGRFDAGEITRIGYPAVAAYLQANKETLGLPHARVTHVWAQEREIAGSIAQATGIEYIAGSLEAMAAEVDAVLLCRDDPENHVAMARPFLAAGVPLFIDKPLAATRADLDWFEAEAGKGRFFMSCSSMRYAGECRSVRQDLSNLGPLQLITAVGKKDWMKYGVHMLEAIFAIAGQTRVISVINTGDTGKEIATLEFEDGLKATLHLFMDIAPTFQVSVFGKNAWRMADIKNSYAMFRDNIIEFIRSVEEGKPRIAFEETRRIMQVLIAAQESREAGGNKIMIDVL
ncbi:Gfo/Idh/MocA family protein [Niabella drilacis]|uniref:Oxidoreductase family, NAD-binding Rossmann fold n=1 Tax=Niabella drilacis (strain DSM 25811 / CCM 8410 / CCUG 62505 / LMG 26954 / E90) TaxID=1285928 RepID=A0A1G6LWT8_NIADE|nr:Gfo/Idh/MocA family oxidoreductase [Niabella drilacis]SDC47195.1 Oxidoreductase family, NAD-binding Rossmann fold [Niabella drilacis]